MDIGTGKDLDDYLVGGVPIPYHLIDIHDPGYEYNVYQFLNDFDAAYRAIEQRCRLPILCGGTGLYIDAVVRRFPLSHAPIDPAFRQAVSHLTDEELTQRLSTLVKLHNHTDTECRERLVRALEIQEYALQHPEHHVVLPEMEATVVAIHFPRQVLVDRIEQRLQQRLTQGMADEVERILQSGVSPERLMRYGLEYRHLTRYVTHQCDYNQMYNDLFRDIRRFAKRQMTYLRHMERNGVVIHWVDGQQGTTTLCQQIISNYF